MNDTAESTSVLVISNDNSLVDALLANNTTGRTFNARDAVQVIIDDPSLLDNNSIVIFDVGTNSNTLDAAIAQTVLIKQTYPTQALILVGDQELLGEVLKSSVQPLVFRAFPKPVSANQIGLAFKSGDALHAQLAAKQAAGEDITMIGPAGNRTNVESLANTRSNNSAIFAALGVAAIAVVGWLIFSGGQEDNEPITENQITEEVIDESVETEVTVSATVQRINDLNQQATLALMDNRIIAPKGDNALDYYEQVLALDAYDTTAYEGKKNVASRLRSSYEDLVEKAQFNRALQVIDILQRIDPLNPSNDKLRKDLQTSINSHVKKIQDSGTSEEIAETTAVLEQMGQNFEGSKSAIDALKAEQNMVAKIDVALASNSLIPPQKDNAYALVSEALKSNSVSKANITPRVKSLSEKLLGMAASSLKADDFAETDKLKALIKRLNVNKQELAALNKQIATRKAAIEAEKKAAIAKENEKEAPDTTQQASIEPIAPKITPATVLKRSAPRYPSRALNRNIEGWVEVKFKVDRNGEPMEIEVVSSEPEGVFESAATKAVKKWRFDPAKNEETGLAVISSELSTKLQFKLDEE